MQNVGLHILIYAGAGFYFHIERSPVFAIGLVLAGILIWISVIDFAHFRIPDVATVLLGATGLLALFWQPRNEIIDHLLAAVLWPLLFWTVAEVYKKLRGWDGLGFGDIKLIGVLALWVGLAGTATVVLAAALAGITTILVLGVAGKQVSTEIPKSAVAFAPFLCLSTWVVWIYQVTN